MKTKAVLIAAALIALSLSGQAAVPGDDPESILGIEVGPYLIYPDDNTKMILMWSTVQELQDVPGGEPGEQAPVLVPRDFRVAWGITEACETDSVTIDRTDEVSNNMYSHTFSQLAPGTKYFYRLDVLDDFGEPLYSYHGDFYAAPNASDSSFSFFAIGDTQKKIQDVLFKIAYNMRHILHDQPTAQTFLLHLGDIEFWYRSWAEDIPITETFFLKGQGCRERDELLKRIPTMLTRGNHDRQSMIDAYFPYPQMNHGNNALYSFDYGNAHFISLDTEVSNLDTLRSFIDQDLGSTNKMWKIAYFHQPGYRWTDYSANYINERVIPLLRNHGVQLILNGHVHNSTYLHAGGVDMAISGGGGGTLEGDCGPNTGECKSYNFLKVDVAGETLTVTARDELNSSTIHWFKVTAGVRADFDYEFKSDSIKFHDRSTSFMSESPLTSWSWDFDGDGVEDSSEQNPDVPFGVFATSWQGVEVALRVKNSRSEYHVRRKLIPETKKLLLLSFNGGESVTAGSTKEIKWFFNPAKLVERGCDGFTAQVELTNLDGTIRDITEELAITPGYGSLGWTVGEVSNGTAPVGDNYKVRVRVGHLPSGPEDPVASCVAIAESERFFSITEPHPSAVVPDFSYALDGLRVQFTDLSKCPVGSPDSWGWSLGDGSSSSQQNPNHRYLGCGHYEVSLVVGCSGATNTVTKTVKLCEDGQYGDIKVIAPNTDTRWEAGRHQTIRWNPLVSGSPIADKLTVSLWRDQTPLGTIGTIPASNAADGNWGWTIPGQTPAGTRHRIKLQVEGDPSVFGFSQYFEILQASGKPFGSFDYPIDGEPGLAGSVAVTGWALDDVGVTSVRIYRDPVAGEGSDRVLIGEAGFVEGMRPDVAALYPGYPNSTRAGWGYMLLTNMLPNSGNGTFRLHAVATDTADNVTTLGSKTITIDNANATLPFGTLDTPAPSEVVSGSNYKVQGWALTPQPNTIPPDGSTITVYVDGLPVGKLNRGVGHSAYNIYREDIASAFPGYNNSNGAVGYYYLDTTTLADGVHTIAWEVVDDAGNTDGIGSRFFSVDNSAPPSASITLTSPNGGESWLRGTTRSITWNASNVSHVRIELLNGGGGATTLSPSTAASAGTFAWAIPTMQAVGSGYAVRVTDADDPSITDTSNATFSIAAPTDSLTVTSPNGGETWVMGATQPITWTATSIANVSIELLKAGSVVSIISPSTAASAGTFNWTIPTTLTAGNDYLVRITDTSDSSVTDTSNNPFSVAVGTITVASPNGGELWLMGDTKSITWNATHVSTVKIRLLKAGKVVLTLSASATASPGVFSWVVPSTLTAATDYKIHIADASNSSVRDTSNSYFSIAADANASILNVTSPNGGELWAGGVSRPIQWNAINVSSFRITLLKAGVEALTVVPSTTGKSFSWTVPVALAAATDYAIRITDSSDASVTDTSDATFTITSSSTGSTVGVTSPNGGESWPMGATKSITWTATGVSNVRVELLKAGTVVSTPSTSTAASAGTFGWTIPTTLTPGTDYTVRVTDTNSSTVTDTSNATFSITGDAAASITVTSPNGGESWPMGATKSITWTATDVSNVRIELLKAGSVVSTLSPSTAASAGTFSWSIHSTLTAGTDYSVRITDPSSSTVSDTSNATFSIAAATGSITVTSPNGGESWTTGTTKSITWTATSVSNVRIELLKAGNVVSTLSPSTTASAGTFSWSIPSTLAAGTDYSVRITDPSSSTVSDTSNATFSITATTGSITVTSPNGGESWTYGAVKSITWTYGGVASSVEISLWQNNVKLGVIASSVTASAGSYPWTVGAGLASVPIGSGFKIRIKETSTALYDQSDGSFTISL